MEGDFEKNLNKFLKLNPDLDALLQKIDLKKIDGTYYAGKVIKDGRLGFLLKIRLFIPVTKKESKRRTKNTVRVGDIIVNGKSIKVVVLSPPEYIDVSSISYDGLWLNFRTKRGRKYRRVFIGLPLNWEKKKVSYNNGVLEIVTTMKC